jgi:methionine aminopeptidase, type II (EC 3.4.11.18)
LIDNNFKGSQRIKNVPIEDYIKAGKIAAEVREIVRVKDWIGKTVYEICEEVENEIKKRR